jgi:hypothetical protein
MRLLKLNDGGGFSLTLFREDEIPPYAILSHTWGTEEVTFKDLTEGTGEQKIGYQKLRFCGNQAKEHGLQYFWADTCCIEKSNEKELTTAINSMFYWYQRAARCYVYLSDVSITGETDLGPVDWSLAFRHCRWFTRGWTLQELLAPKIIEFYSREYVMLGDKRSLEQVIYQTTGIPIEALQGRQLSDFSVEERLRWAEKRETTEEEDKAYCLLGIFAVSLPLVYGERYANAMKRLRREIGEHILDSR